MIVQLCTVTDETNDVVWIDAYIDENKIVVGWRIPLYIDEDVEDLIIYGDELNLFIGGSQITVKATVDLLDILKERLK